MYTILYFLEMSASVVTQRTVVYSKQALYQLRHVCISLDLVASPS
jgi:hypothetical protein